MPKPFPLLSHHVAFRARMGLVLVLAAALLAALPSAVEAQTYDRTYTVDTFIDYSLNQGDCEPGEDPCSLRAGIQQASQATGISVLIVLEAGDYILGAGGDGSGELTADVAGGGITIVGAGAGATTIWAEDGARILSIAESTDVTLTGVTLRNGSVTDDGGAIHASGGLHLVDTVLAQNTAGGHGGAVYLASTGRAVTVEDSTFSNNTAGHGCGGAIFDGHTRPVTVTASTFAQNAAHRDGGGGDDIGGGGAICQAWAVGGSLVIADSDFTDNVADVRGGALKVDGNSTATVTDSRFTGNVSVVRGGAVYVGSQGTASFTRTVVHANRSPSGGAIYSNGALTVDDSILTGNRGPQGGSGRGGAIHAADGSLLLEDSTVAGNRAEFRGGAIYTGGATAQIEHSTITGNTAVASTGGGIHADSTSDQVSVTDSTLADNTAAPGPGQQVFTWSALRLERTIVSGHGGGAACGSHETSGSFVSDGYNLSSDASCGLSAGQHDVVGTDPLLAALADNGGFTRTRAIAADSPARDAGGTGCAALDQRGTARPQGGACDIGAFELAVSALSGQVTATRTGLPVAGADVVVVGAIDAIVATNTDGQYEVEGLVPGDYTVTVSAHRFVTQSRTVTVVEGADATVDVALETLVEPGVVRFGGPDRFATAALLSADAFDPGVDVVYVATGLEFADALSGGVAAALDDAPVLLVAPQAIPEPTAVELERLAAGRIVILGGTVAVSAEVEADLAGFTDGPVERLSGTDRFATAAAVSATTFPDGAGTVYVGTGLNFPDALTGVPAAASAPGPLLLVADTVVPGATAAELDRLAPERIVVLGGENAVGAAVADALGAWGMVERVSGPERFTTAADLAGLAFADADAVHTVFVATGLAFPDALAAGAVAGAIPGPVLLVTDTAIPTPTVEQLERLGPQRIVVMGGERAVSPTVATALEAFLD